MHVPFAISCTAAQVNKTKCSASTRVGSDWQIQCPLALPFPVATTSRRPTRPRFRRETPLPTPPASPPASAASTSSSSSPRPSQTSCRRPRPSSVRSNDPAARRPFRAFRRPLSSLFINYWARSKTNSLARSPLLSNTATSDAGCEIYPGQIPAQCGGPAQCGASGPAGTAARHSLTG